jgi:WD40 repeat protein
MIHGVIDIPARGAPYSTQDWIVEYDEEQVYVRKLADRQLLATLASYAGWPKPMPAYSSQRNLLASADGPNHIHVWDADTWRAQHEIDVPGGALREMAFSADGERLIVACAAGFVGEWRFSSNSWREVFPTTEGSGHSKLATSTTDSIWAVVPWNAKAVELRLMGEADAYARLAVGSYVNSLRFSPDGKLLAVGDASSAISLWDAQSGRSRGTLRGHTGEIRMTAFSPDGAVLASASADSTIRLWSLATRRELFILKQHERPISVVEFLSPRRLVAIDDLRRQLIDFDASVSPPNGGS